MVAFGVLYGVLHGVTLDDLHTPVGLLSLSWVAGSVISVLIALQEFQTSKADTP